MTNSIRLNRGAPVGAPVAALAAGDAAEPFAGLGATPQDPQVFVNLLFYGLVKHQADVEAGTSTVRTPSVRYLAQAFARCSLQDIERAAYPNGSPQQMVAHRTLDWMRQIGESRDAAYMLRLYADVRNLYPQLEPALRTLLSHMAARVADQELTMPQLRQMYIRELTRGEIMRVTGWPVTGLSRGERMLTVLTDVFPTDRWEFEPATAVGARPATAEETPPLAVPTTPIPMTEALRRLIARIGELLGSSHPRRDPTLSDLATFLTRQSREHVIELVGTAFIAGPEQFDTLMGEFHVLYTNYHINLPVEQILLRSTTGVHDPVAVAVEQGVGGSERVEPTTARALATITDMLLDESTRATMLGVLQTQVIAALELRYGLRCPQLQLAVDPENPAHPLRVMVNRSRAETHLRFPAARLVPIDAVLDIAQDVVRLIQDHLRVEILPR